MKKADAILTAAGEKPENRPYYPFATLSPCLPDLFFLPFERFRGSPLGLYAALVKMPWGTGGSILTIRKKFSKPFRAQDLRQKMTALPPIFLRDPAVLQNERRKDRAGEGRYASHKPPKRQISICQAIVKCIRSGNSGITAVFSIRQTKLKNSQVRFGKSYLTNICVKLMAHPRPAQSRPV